ncbi:MAG: hypothetical protein K2X01_02985 [Cyanobacteria bacterium]|nr:hypothetical protein [Cyanobacteriota bacterium]
MDDLQSLFEPNADAVKMTIVTRGYLLEGLIYLSKLSKDKRRLTNLLNGDKRFIAMTKVKVMDRITGKVDPTEYPYLHININSIEMVKPSQESGFI